MVVLLSRDLKADSGSSVRDFDHCVLPRCCVVSLGLTELDSDGILQGWLFISLFQAPIKHRILIQPHYVSPSPSRAWQEQAYREALLNWGLPGLVSDQGLSSRNNSNWVSLKLPHLPSHPSVAFVSLQQPDKSIHSRVLVNTDRYFFFPEESLDSFTLIGF